MPSEERGDYITKAIHGDEAIRAIGKIVLWGAHRLNPSQDVLKLGGATGIGGVVLPDLVPDSDKFEMWECEIVVIPLRKYRSKKLGEGGFDGHRIDQVITSDYGNPDRWGEKYFDKEEHSQ